MRCLVTGAAGFIGSHLCELLLEQKYQVIGLDDLSNGKISNIQSIKDNQNFHMIYGDIKKADLPEVDFVFHLAAKADIVPSIENPTGYHDTNVNGTLRLLEFYKNKNLKKFVYAASSSCYGIPYQYPTPEEEACRPQYPYALTKWVAEQYVLHWSKLYKIPAVSLRLFNVYGPRHRTSGAYGAVFGVFMAQLANNLPITIVGSGFQKRDFTYVKDVCMAFLMATKYPTSGVYNIGSDGSYDINYLGKLLGAEKIERLPERPGEPNTTFADISKFNKETGWYPIVSFERGVQVMRKLIPEYKDAPLWTKEKIEKATEKWFEAFA